MIHPSAICETDKIGEGTRIWAFTHVLPGAVIGADCILSDHVFVESEVVVGNRVTVKCGVQLWDGTVIEDDVFIGPNATFTNYQFPRNDAHPREVPRTVVRRGASIGGNASILAGVEIGTHSMVGAGAVVTQNVPPYAIVHGSPARITGYVGTDGERDLPPTRQAETGDAIKRTSKVRDVQLLDFPEFSDLRGNLVVAECEAQLPFVPQRIFMIQDVSSKHIRGEHAHRECGQVLVCTRGSVTLMVDDGERREEHVLDSPTKAVHVPPMIWAAQYQFSKDASLLVLASHPYDDADYIRDYAEWVVANGTG